MAKAKEVERATTVVIELPIGDVTEHEYLSRHVEARFQTVGQQVAMRRIWRGLQSQGAKLGNGRPVTRSGDAVKWILEQIEAGMRVG